MRGGTDPYLCEDDVSTFKGLIAEYTGAMKCISTREALSIAHYLKNTRQQTAIALLESIGSHGLADDLREQCISEPDPLREFKIQPCLVTDAAIATGTK
jgi:hypothetical protein